MQPRPIAETSGPALPSLRRCVTIVSLIDFSLSFVARLIRGV